MRTSGPILCAAHRLAVPRVAPSRDDRSPAPGRRPTRSARSTTSWASGSPTTTPTGWSRHAGGRQRAALRPAARRGHLRADGDGRSWAAALHAGPDKQVVGIELNASYLRGATSGVVTAVCTPVRRGRTLATFLIEITDESGRPTATGRLTCLTKSD